MANDIVTLKDIVVILKDKYEILTKAQIEGLVRDCFDIIAESLADGSKVKIVDFGAFSTKDTKARKGINPQTKKAITIPASKKIKFSASSTLKDKI